MRPWQRGLHVGLQRDMLMNFLSANFLGIANPGRDTRPIHLLAAMIRKVACDYWANDDDASKRSTA